MAFRTRPWWIRTSGSTHTPPWRAARRRFRSSWPCSPTTSPTSTCTRECTNTSAAHRFRCWQHGGRNDEIFGPAGALAFGRDLPKAEVNLLDGGHFLLESRLDAVVTLMRPFLAEHASG